MSNNIAISLRDISKTYRLWHHAGVWSPVAKLAGRLMENGAAKKSADDFYALRNISCDIGVGECVGIIGRNGCGKSTLLQILAGIVKPTSGEGRVSGEVAALLELGTGFHPDFTGRENVALNNAMIGLSRTEAEKRLNEIAAFADLGKFMEEPIRTYSTGMLLRLGFACAVAVNPEVLIVDEALAVGDIFFQQKCYDYMREKMSKKTRVIVSHDMQAVTAFCTRVMVLEKGRLAFDGSPLAAVEYYLKALHDSQAGPQQNVAATLQKNNRGKTDKALPVTAEWRPVAMDSTGGAQELRFTQVEIAVNQMAWSSIAKPGDQVTIRAEIECDARKPEILFGYLVRDKTGNAVFGENSAGISGGVIAVEPGKFEISFAFRWPEVRPAEYFLTLGIGEGRDPVRHRIQCWAHNLLLINAISPLKPVHCLFNNPINDFTCTADAATVRNKI